MDTARTAFAAFLSSRVRRSISVSHALQTRHHSAVAVCGARTESAISSTPNIEGLVAILSSSSVKVERPFRLWASCARKEMEL